MVTFRAEIPRFGSTDQPLQLEAASGDVIFVVGANGSGKSALIQKLTLPIGDAEFTRVSAHRQNWASSDAPDVTPSQRVHQARNIRAFDRDTRSRWRGNYLGEAINGVLAQLIATENVWARKIAELHAARQVVPHDQAVSPLVKVNNILKRGAIPLSIEITDADEIFAGFPDGSRTGFTRLSDGEKNAVSLAIQVATSANDHIFLIDEPERHLHRSIMIPLLSGLFTERRDSIFFIATHEVELPAAIPNSKTLLLRSCRWANDEPVSWDLDVLEKNATLPEGMRTTVVGARRKILFVEGTATSLDRNLYALLFPSVSVYAKEGFPSVIQAVRGLGGANDAHWVDAYGIVDLDDRPAADVVALNAEKIFPLSVSAIESVYFCSAALEALGRRQAETFGLAAGDIIAAARAAAIAELSRDVVANHMVSRRSERLIREAFISQMPRSAAIPTAGQNITIAVPNAFADERQRYDAMVAVSDFEGLLQRYVVRESGALEAIARALRFRNRGDYEDALVAFAAKDEPLRTALMALMGDLPARLN